MNNTLTTILLAVCLLLTTGIFIYWKVKSRTIKFYKWTFPESVDDVKAIYMELSDNTVRQLILLDSENIGTEVTVEETRKENTND